MREKGTERCGKIHKTQKSLNMFKFWYRRYKRGGHYVIEGKFTTYFEDMEQKIIKKALSKGD